MAKQQENTRKNVNVTMVLYRIRGGRKTGYIGDRAGLAMVGPGVYLGPASKEAELSEEINRVTEWAEKRNSDPDISKAEVVPDYAVIQTNAAALESFYTANKPQPKAKKAERVNNLVAALKNVDHLPAEVQAMLAALQ